MRKTVRIVFDLPARAKPAHLAAMVFAFGSWCVPATDAAPVCGQADLSKLTGQVYVSPDGVDGAGCGATPAAACKTLQQGINNCGASGCGVLVRWGFYPTSAMIQLRDGVNVYGGCVFDGSAGTPYRSVVQASPAPGTPAVSAANINTPTLLYGLVVIGKDETAAGTASLGMAVSNSQALTISHTVLASGKGGDGATAGDASDGDSGGGGGSAEGNSGGASGPACPSAPVAGGAGQGGQGADFQQVYSYTCIIWCYCENNNYPNSLGRNGADSGSIAGGTGAPRATEGAGCNNHTDRAQDGYTGNPGNPGACASVGGVANSDAWGGFSAGQWIPRTGGAGQTGDVGSGGGGGGSGGMAVLPGTDIPGRPGGGGGGGGCGGPAGAGGQQGGASIPLVLVSSAASLDQTNSSAIIPGPGGRGGTGGEAAGEDPAERVT